MHDLDDNALVPRRAHALAQIGRTGNGVGVRRAHNLRRGVRAEVARSARWTVSDARYGGIRGISAKRTCCKPIAPNTIVPRRTRLALSLLAVASFQ